MAGDNRFERVTFAALTSISCRSPKNSGKLRPTGTPGRRARLVGAGTPSVVGFSSQDLGQVRIRPELRQPGPGDRAHPVAQLRLLCYLRADRHRRG